MEKDSLICNFKNCFKQLTDEVFVTFCSHIFCVDHGRKLNGKCFACNHDLSEHQIISKNLNMSDNSRMFFLAGLAPNTIMSIASQAIAFWQYHKKHEKSMSQRLMAHTEKKLQNQSKQNEEKDCRIRSLEHEMEKLKTENQQLKVEVATNIDKLQRAKKSKNDVLF